MNVKQITAFVMCVVLSIAAFAADLQVGVGRADITPDIASDSAPVWLTGYAARTTPATGVIHRVWVKALVFEQSSEQRAVIITADLLCLSREMTSVVASAVGDKHGIPRSRIFFNASHTHSAPCVWPNLSVCHNFTPAELRDVIRWNHRVTASMIAAVDMAMTNRAPARLTTGRGTAGFAINRRRREIAPVDHTVPVLRVCALDGATRAVLFNYACHSTTLTGGNLLVNGDYAGFAMVELEAAFPGATALFIQGCGADQNPHPRSTVELARQYGHAIAETVRGVLAAPMRAVNAPIHAAFSETRLDFAPVPLESYRAEVLDKNIFKHKRARLMLEAFNRGTPVTSIPYPVQALRFGEDLTFLFLSGEVVVDYALRAKREHPEENLIVAGYSNETHCYIPSLRVLREGGYEADSSMIYYGLPGPFTEKVEETVFSAIREVMDAVR